MNDSYACPDCGGFIEKGHPHECKKPSVSFPIDIKHIQIVPFAKAMDEVLTKNDHKGGWHNCDIQYLRYRLVEELGEYFAWASRGSPSSISEAEYRQMRKELVDIANFAMMLWDRS
ncbi:MAG: hypothetical protein WC479_07370 [Candidatus Izemoplasmatales bacterium]